MTVCGHNFSGLHRFRMKTIGGRSHDNIPISEHTNQIIAVTHGQRSYIMSLHDFSCFRYGGLGMDDFDFPSHDFLNLHDAPFESLSTALPV